MAVPKGIILARTVALYVEKFDTTGAPEMHAPLLDVSVVLCHDKFFHRFSTVTFGV